MSTPVRPSHPQLARLFDLAVQSGAEIRYVDETQLVVFRKNTLGCGGCLLLVLLGLATAFIVPIILLLLGTFSNGGQVTTYTLRPNGRVKKRTRPA